VIVVRLFNTVGPRQIGRYGMVLPNFVRQALDGAPITIFGTGLQSRCFCDVRDTIESILRLVGTESAVGEVINVGSDEEISIEGLARVVKKRTNSESAITYIPYDQAYEPGFEDMQRRVPALTKLQKLTGFRPATPLTEIVDRVVAHFQEKAGKELPAAATRSSSATASV
jgi:UDP-glucose 4-epimerase